MSRKQKTSKINSSVAGVTFVRKVGLFSEYKLNTNNLTIIYRHIPDTGVVTSNITYRVGSRDEATGETGLAHMLEHMLFKPTTQDLKRNIDSGAMQFERETGCILNANTWNDRTTYYFSYPVEHVDRALLIESERMTGVVLSDTEFQPERGNVLSEFDMYNGDPFFALNMQMIGCAFLSHPYGHETIGFREDIEEYTTEKLERFYRNYYRPDNATLMIFGDIEETEALKLVKKHFAGLKNPKTPIPRHTIREGKQEGVRRAEIHRPSKTNILALGVKHAAFPSKEWLAFSVLGSVLAEGTDSILHKKLVDNGLATTVTSMIGPTSEENLGVIYITLAPGQKHSDIEERTLEIIRSLTSSDLKKHVQKVIAQEKTSLLFAENSSLRIAMELTEFVSADAWEQYVSWADLLETVTPAEVANAVKAFETKDNMTIGYFIGTN